MQLKLIASVLALSAFTSACTVRATAPRVVVGAPGEVVVARPPPALRIEAVPPPPSQHPELYVWHVGHWRWEHRKYVWHPGHYERRPTATAVWVQPQWVARGGQWVFQQGHWDYR